MLKDKDAPENNYYKGEIRKNRYEKDTKHQREKQAIRNFRKNKQL